MIIDKVSNCKYLGHCINDKLNDDDDMARQRKQIYAQGNALIRKFYMCSETVKISLFKSYCSSLYTSALWCNYRCESLRKLCVAYNNVFRKMTFLPRDCSASLMFAERGLPTCKTLIRKHVYSFMTSVINSCNVNLHTEWQGVCVSHVAALEKITLCAPVLVFFWLVCDCTIWMYFIRNKVNCIVLYCIV